MTGAVNPTGQEDSVERVMLFPLLGLNPRVDTVGAAMKRINDLKDLQAALLVLKTELEQKAKNERADEWCNTEDRLVWRAIHDHRAQVYEQVAARLGSLLEPKP